MRKYYVKRNHIESMIDLIGDSMELTTIRNGWDKDQARQLRKFVMTRLKEIFVEEVEEEEEK